MASMLPRKITQTAPEAAIRRPVSTPGRVFWPSTGGGESGAHQRHQGEDGAGGDRAREFQRHEHRQHISGDEAAEQEESPGLPRPRCRHLEGAEGQRRHDDDGQHVAPERQRFGLHVACREAAKGEGTAMSTAKSSMARWPLSFSPPVA
ncbi:hypothetical protein DdX_22305 [Ditylenchus destructor]|uniref:Uncharacterized protein n=1 Tax=Ditylenchus destructor TaxID=166010 RepID=A0AAD4MDQ3_9BILA|nr:hypothetical protein DdX_22305 [Ditylenchus destructor]